MRRLQKGGVLLFCLVVGCEGTLGGAGNASGADGGRGSGDASPGLDGAAQQDAPSNDGAPGGGGPNVDRTDPKLHEWELDPAELDPLIADSTGIEYAALDTRVAPLGRLVIFLPGANNLAIWWADHARLLSSFGFHAVVPHYNNRWSTNGTCNGQGADCSLNTRWEALVGEDVSPAITIARRDSAEGRVVRMLEHLRGEHPGGDWGYYLTEEGGLRYDRIVIAGISHGAASAGLYGERRAFTRVVMHASGPAGTKAAAKATPVSEWYGFVHTEDGAYEAITDAWAYFEMEGTLTSVDGASPPYGGAHQLVSNVPIGDPDEAHIAVCVSGPAPMMGGDYTYEPAWRYLYDAPE